MSRADWVPSALLRRPETHRPRTRLGLRPVGSAHDVPQNGLPGATQLLGASHGASGDVAMT